MTHAELQTRRFLEIHSFIFDPFKTSPDNYEAAEAEYIKEYGSRRYKNYITFATRRSELSRRERAKKVR